MKMLRLLLLLTVLPSMAGCATAVMNGTATGDDPRREASYPTAQQDARITREVRMKIYQDPLLGDERIQVATRAGVVTLSGSVDNRLHVSRAMEVARGVEGVRGINLELRLKGTP